MGLGFVVPSVTKIRYNVVFLNRCGIMPIYDYECQSCGHHLERIQKLSEKPLTQCPQCHDDSLRKLLSAPHFQLKGEGWYVTDFKNKKETTDNKKEITDKKTETTDKKTETTDKTTETS